MEQEDDTINTQIETSISEPEQNDVVVDGTSEKKKSGNGMLIGMILCVILAVGGIGFGVWAIIDGNAKKNDLVTEISALKDQINESNEKNEQLPYQYENNESSDVDDGTVLYDSNSVFEVKEWALSIRLPENISNIEYKYSDSGYSDVCDSAVHIVGLLRNGKRIDAGELSSVASILRCTDMFPYGKMAFYDGVFGYYYEFPNGLSVYDSQDLQDVVQELKNVLEKEESYTKN